MKPNITALTRATLVSIWYVVFVTIGGELSPAFKNFFVRVGGHHWTGKSIMTVLVFVLVYVFFSRVEESKNPEKGIYKVIGSTILGGLIIFGYFAWHYFKGA
jgi:hypothetical protein